MGAGNQYRVIIRRIIEQEAVGQPSHGNPEVIAICDDASGNYLATVVGWSGKYRHDQVFHHLRRKDDKLWIECNGTEEDIVERLVEADVARENILRGLIHPRER